MSWIRMDDDLYDHPKVLRAGPLAFALHISALGYCGRHLTDGLIPREAVPSLSHFDGIALVDSSRGKQAGPTIHVDVYVLADRLVEVGLWERDGDDYRIHQYLDYNPARENVKADRQAAKIRMRKVREQQRSPEVRPKFNDPVPTPVPRSSAKAEEVLRARAREDGDASVDNSIGTRPERTLTPAAEVKATLKEAKALWLAERHRHGHSRFTDTQALKGLALRIEASLAGGNVWQDIEAALRKHANDEKANPWYADAWVSEAANERELGEHLLRKSQGYSREAPPHECLLSGGTTCVHCGLGPQEHGGGFRRRADAPHHIGGAVSAFVAGLQP